MDRDTVLRTDRAPHIPPEVSQEEMVRIVKSYYNKLPVDPNVLPINEVYDMIYQRLRACVEMMEGVK